MGEFIGVPMQMQEEQNLPRKKVRMESDYLADLVVETMMMNFMDELQLFLGSVALDIQLIVLIRMVIRMRRTSIWLFALVLIIVTRTVYTTTALKRVTVVDVCHTAEVLKLKI